MGEGSIKSFTDLETWQISHKLVVSVFKELEQLDKYDSLRNQIERCAVSVTSNLAEGFGRHSSKDKSHFYVMARGSAYELQNQLIIARDTKKISEEVFNSLATLSVSSTKLIHGLIRSLEKNRANS